ncbi:MAG: Smr/MutS family protein [Rhodospirillales bacterium]|nr:Smr/MutS family protein [Rhodospirillales bacterium]
MTKSRAPDRPPTERPVSADEKALWQKVMGTVRPLPRGKGRDKPPVPPVPPPVARAQPRTPLPRPVATPPPTPKPPAEPPLEHGEAPGLDKRTRLRLRRGHVEIQRVMDLHGLTQAEAHRALVGFLESAQAAGKRAVLVITGKGLTPGSGVLRAAVPRWLNEPALRSMIRAFSHAAPKDGGEGALYVLLRRKR